MRGLALLAARRGPQAHGWAAQTGAHRAPGHVRTRIRDLPTRGPLIGHCRLATDGDWRDAANNQPFTADDGRTWIAHNGYVPDHEAIARSAGWRLRTRNDSELLAHVAASAPTIEEALAYVEAVLRDVPYAVLLLRGGRIGYAADGLPLFRLDRPEGAYLCSRDPGGGSRITVGSAACSS